VDAEGLTTATSIEINNDAADTVEKKVHRARQSWVM
jgi:hypothetical protein